MAKSIKSFNADDEVLGLIEQEKITNFSKWANDMIKKGYASTKQIIEKSELENPRVILN